MLVIQLHDILAERKLTSLFQPIVKIPDDLLQS